MKKKLRVGIIFGGQSSEHEVSIQSAKHVLEALNKDKYEPVLIGITKKGSWQLLPTNDFKQIVSRTYRPLPETIDKNLAINSFQQDTAGLDVVFPLLHGPYGEDGTVQGLLKLMGIAFVGADVLGSAVGMDKDVMKRLLRDSGIPVVKFLVSHKKDKEDLSFENITKELGLPFFVKPANAGSSIGVAKVAKELEFGPAINKAFEHDQKILIEQAIPAREIECSVLGNEEKITSVPGEVIPTYEFYDYEAKYIDADGAGLEIPARLLPEQIKRVQALAIKACEVLCIDGMARVDFFLDKTTDKLYLNEVNTIPGFTSISMYPKLWQASGISYTELIDQLIQLALKRSNTSRSEE
ncbi:MAG TPA: D-alanine--D-alanine ligase family protein [Patescibacteria group bacterium]|nr:D-alanine--D-alanine ligase family protein [Patescibacteria group bacterium]